jgi:hypothetical protein
LVEVQVADPAMTDAIWQHIKAGMIECREGQDETAGWLWQECRSGRAFLIVAWEETTILGAAIVQFQHEGRTLRGLGFTGVRVDEWWPQLSAKVVEIMRDGGCTRFVDGARPGMRKYYPDAKVVGTIFEVKI